MKSEGQIVKEEEPAQDDVDDLEILEIFTKSVTPSEASHYNDALQPTTSKEATDIDLEIIALDKEDVDENANVGSCANVGDNNMDCVSDSGASAASSKKSDDSIAVGESAISPIASPKKQAENEVKMKDYGEEDDDDIICID
uniref:Candidate secreted effector n=1 Tax=Meloidogyne incognita TaxID=6306 RepID=A0A914L557_MELIC